MSQAGLLSSDIYINVAQGRLVGVFFRDGRVCRPWSPDQYTSCTRIQKLKGARIRHLQTFIILLPSVS